MTIRLVPVSSFNNPNLPIGDFSNPLARPDALGIYSMLSPEDESGNGNHLTMGGHTFGPQGMVCTPVEGYFADTGILEPDIFTVVVCHNVAQPTATSAISSALNEGASPFTGHRFAITAAGLQSLSIGVTPGSYFINGGNAYGGWTAYAYTVSGKTLTIQRGSGQQFTGTAGETLTKRQAVATTCIGGTKIPAAASICLPPSGIIGAWAMYAGDYGVGGRAQLINDTRTLMARRGVVIP